MNSLDEERKREPSPSIPTQTVKKPRFREFGKSSIFDSSDEEVCHDQIITLESYNLDQDDDFDQEFDEAYSLTGKPACRSILNELLDSVNQDEYSMSRRQISCTSSALGIHGGIAEDDDEDEDEKTTLPLTRSFNKPPADEVDAFFTSTSTDRLDYVRQHQPLFNKHTPAFITSWPHFITSVFFEKYGPKDRSIERDEKTASTSAGYFDTDFSKGYKMGSGEHSDVYYTRQLSTSKVCATKKSKLPFTGWEDRWLQLIEVNNLLKVQHSKHCVKILRSWEEQGYLYIQTEICTSGNLDEYLNHTDRNIPENIIWKIFYETVIGINDIHKENIAHLDLKPSNILVDNYGFIRIADFGVSIQTPAEMRWVKGEGDRKYMAPELLREDYNKTADIYSLGMLLLELATGLYLPGKGEGWEIIRFGDFSNQEEALAKLSPDLSQLIMKLLTRDPLARPSVKEIMNLPEFLKIHEIQQDENEKSSLFDYVREREKAASEAAKAREHNDKYSTPESRISGYAYPSPSL